jgi:hypothetical protein
MNRRQIRGPAEQPSRGEPSSLRNLVTSLEDLLVERQAIIVQLSEEVAHDTETSESRRQQALLEELERLEARLNKLLFALKSLLPPADTYTVEG